MPFQSKHPRRAARAEPPLGEKHMSFSLYARLPESFAISKGFCFGREKLLVLLFEDSGASDPEWNRTAISAWVFVVDYALCPGPSRQRGYVVVR